MRMRFEGVFVLASVCALVISSGGGAALAGEPVPSAPPASAVPAPTTPAAPAPAPSPATTSAPASPRGVIVVASSDEATPAARSLAREVYREAALCPTIDEATARALVGDAPREASGDARVARLTSEIGELRASIAKVGDGVSARRLLASLGEGSGAVLVVAVSVEGGRPVARVLRVSGAAYERVELGATVETSADGARAFQWSGAPTALLRLMPPAPAPPPNARQAPGATGVTDALQAPGATDAPLAPLAATESAPAPGTATRRASSRPPRGPLDESKPFWRSTWFWASTGGVTVAGVTVLVLVLTSGKARTVHLDGQVLP
jgi:hypothetical protein